MDENGRRKLLANSVLLYMIGLTTFLLQFSYIFNMCFRNGAKVDARAREQQTPLHIASRLGNIDIVLLLLQSGAGVDDTTKDLYTALHIAAKEGQEEVSILHPL